MIGSIHSMRSSILSLEVWHCCLEVIGNQRSAVCPHKLPTELIHGRCLVYDMTDDEDDEEEEKEEEVQDHADNYWQEAHVWGKALVNVKFLAVQVTPGGANPRDDVDWGIFQLLGKATSVADVAEVAGGTQPAKAMAPDPIFCNDPWKPRAASPPGDDADLGPIVNMGRVASKEELLARMSPKDRALAVTLQGMLREVVDEAFSSSVT